MENMKVCKKCGEEKSIDLFPNLKSNLDGKRGSCKSCQKEYVKNYLETNPDVEKKVKKYNSDIQKKNLTTILEKRKANDQYLKYQREYQTNLRKNNRSYSIATKFRNSVRNYIMYGVNKHRPTKLNNLVISIVGCSLEELRNHLQSTAISNGYEGFDINNYDPQVFHIDHIIPCSKFDLTKEEDIYKCFNWENMQILTVKENIIKSNIE